MAPKSLLFFGLLLGSALTAAADSLITVTSEVLQGPHPVPGCGGTITGTSSASISFSCMLPDSQFPVTYSGSASAQVGLWPFGVGISFNAISRPLVSWSQEFAIEGAQGNGFVIPTVTGPCGEYRSSGRWSLNCQRD
jgi:hypothetical protein